MYYKKIQQTGRCLRGFLSTCLVLLAITGAVAAGTDGQGAVLLETVSANIKSGSVTAFTFTATDAKGKTIYNETGSIRISGNKFKLEMPEELTVVSDGTTRWIYKPQNDEIIVSESDPENTDILENPFAILNTANRNYTVVPAVQNGTSQGKPVKIITLKAKNSGNNYRLITIAVSGNNVPAELVFHSVDGAKYTVRVDRFSQPGTFPAGDFVFPVKQYSNAVVTDLR